MENINNIELDLSWFKKASCKGASPDLFFPDPEDPDLRKIQKSAEEICSTCPVIVECAEYALVNGEKVGTWGGKSSWGSSHRPEGMRYIERLKLKREYNMLQQLPDSREKRMLISNVAKKLNELKRVRKK